MNPLLETLRQIAKPFNPREFELGIIGKAINKGYTDKEIHANVTHFTKEETDRIIYLYREIAKCDRCIKEDELTIEEIEQVHGYKVDLESKLEEFNK